MLTDPVFSLKMLSASLFPGVRPGHLSSFKHSSHVGLGPTLLQDIILTNYLCRDPISK